MTDTVNDFAAFVLDLIAEGYGTLPIFATTEDAEDAEASEYIALDQHLTLNGIQRNVVAYSADLFESFVSLLTADQAEVLYDALARPTRRS